MQDLENETGESDVRKRLDDMVDQVNLEAPVIARLSKAHVVFATREKPFARTSKGTVRSRETAKVYQGEIDEIYQQHEDQMGSIMSRVH